jgi:hypothetical protein
VEILPPEEPDALYNSTWFIDWGIDHHNTTLQKEFTSYMAQKELKELSSPSALAHPHVSKSEKIRSVQARKKPGESVLTQLFTANLSDHEARLTSLEFTISARQAIALPALKIPEGETIKQACGCQVQKCPKHDGELIDPNGNHAILCHAGLTARKAATLERALERVFRKAGGRADRQPSTSRLVGEVIPKEQLAVLFAGGQTQEQTKQNGELALELVDALLMAPSATRESVLEDIHDRIP